MTAKVIREALKKIGLNSRDVSVKTQNGGLSSAVYMTVKTTKAYALMSEIKKIAKSEESYERCHASGEILSGGNTFVFVQVDYDLKEQIAA